MATFTSSRDLTRTTLALLFIGVLIAANFWILRPFIPAFVWAVIIVVATWPVLLWIQSGIGGKRGLAAAIMTLALLALLIVPVIAAVLTILEIPERVSALVKSPRDTGLAPDTRMGIRDPLRRRQNCRGLGRIGLCRARRYRGAPCAPCRQYHQLACRSRRRKGDDDCPVPAHRHHRRDTLFRR